MNTDNFDEATNEQASIDWWRAKLMKEEYSEGDPVPEPAPEPVSQAPMPTTPVMDRLVPLKHIFGLCVGVLLIGISIGMYLNEYEWTWEK